MTPAARVAHDSASNDSLDDPDDDFDAAYAAACVALDAYRVTLDAYLVSRAPYRDALAAARDAYRDARVAHEAARTAQRVLAMHLNDCQMSKSRG